MNSGRFCMNVAIFGAGRAGRFLYREIFNKSKDIKVIAFIDNIIQKIEGLELAIYKPCEYFEKYKSETDAVFIAAGAQKTINIMVNTVLTYNITNIYILHDIAGKCKLSPFYDDGSINFKRLRKIKFCEDKPTIPYIEVPVTDKCNLNCKGCLFACNGDSEEKNISYRQLEKDAHRVSELFYDIPWIRILGGEPLLHPKIKEILKLYRDVFPSSEIDLCTNGLLILKMNSDFFESLRKNRITVHVSGYTPTYMLLDKIDELLKNNGIEYTVLKREKFAKYYTLKPNNDKNISFRDCIASGCTELYDGRILKCSAVIAFEKMNQKYGTNYITQKGEDWFDIHTDTINAFEIKKKS